MVTAEELLALTQAYKNLCEATNMVSELHRLGYECEKLATYSNFISGMFDEYMKQSEKADVPEAKSKDETPKPKKYKPSQAEINAHFDALWKLYPSKRGKNSVSTTKRAKLYEVPVASMEKAVKRYVSELEQKGKMDYILNGSTWFNGRYEDYMNDENYNVIDGAEIPNDDKPKGRFDALSPAEMKDYIAMGVINAEDESVNYLAMTEADVLYLTSKGVI